MLSFWSSTTAVDIVRCFRVIINAGQDPEAPRSQQGDSKGDGDSVKAPVQDKAFVLELLRRSNILENLISKFNESINVFSSAMEEYKIAVLMEANMNEIYTHRSADSDSTPAIAEESSIFQSDALPDMKSSLQQKRMLMETLLKFCSDLSHDTKSSAQMFYAGICDGCIVILRDIIAHDSLRNPRLAEIVQLLWICLESSRNNSSQMDDPASVLDVELSARVLKDLLVKLIGEGYRLVDKECRNEVVIVISLILSIFPDIAVPNIIACGLLDLIVSLACIGESSSDAWIYFYPNLKVRNFSTASESDLELKRLLWMILSQMMMTGDRDVMICVASSPILETMLIYLEYHPTIEASEQSINKEANLFTSSFSPNISLLFQRNSYQSSSHVIFKNPKSISFDSSSEMIPVPREEERSLRSAVDRDPVDNPSVLSSTLPSAKGVLSTLPISQLRQFQMLVCHFLVSYAATMIREFNRIDGPRRILAVIELFSRDYDAHDLIYYLLMILSQCVTTSKISKQYLESNQAVQRMVALFNQFHQYNLLKRNAGIEDMNIQCIRLISMLCENNPSCQEQLSANHGIELLIESLVIYHRDRKPSIGVASKALILQDIYTGAAATAAAIMSTTSSNGHVTVKAEEMINSAEINALVIAAVDCIRTGIVGNPANEAAFVLAEGIDTLLDTLEVLSLKMRGQVYRLLSDILRNKQLLTFFLAWRSAKTMRSSVQLFCHGWLDEELRLGNVSERDIISNLWNPLSNQSWPTDVSIDFNRESLSSSSMSEAVATMPLAVSRLTNAITKANSFMQTKGLAQSALIENLQIQDFDGAYQEIFREVLSVDTRGIIASILNQMDMNISSLVDSPRAGDLGMDRPIIGSFNDLGLTTRDRKVLAIAKMYSFFRANEWWDAVNEASITASDGQTIIRPIAEDLAIIHEEKDRIFDAILSVQMEQMALDQEQRDLDHRQIDDFHDHILDIKNQQIKSEWLKKNAKKRRYQGSQASTRQMTAQ